MKSTIDKDQNMTIAENKSPAKVKPVADSGDENGDIFRVVISGENNVRLNDLLNVINSGFEAGRVSKPQLVAWIIQKFSDEFDEQSLTDIRKQHFNSISWLESLLKTAKRTGELPQQLEALLHSQMQVDGAGRKKSKKVLSSDASSDDMPRDETTK